MSRILKGLMVCLIGVMATAMASGIAIAQAGFFPPLWSALQFDPDSQEIPSTMLPTGDILFDNFEYSDSPYSHGWVPAGTLHYGWERPCFAITEADSQKGSMVLTVRCLAWCVFCLSGDEKADLSRDIRYTQIPSDSNSVVDYIDLNTHPVMSFDFKAPLGVEPFDILEFNVRGVSEANYDVAVRVVPLQPSAEDCIGPLISTEGMYGMQAAVTGFNPAGGLQVTVAVGLHLLDGSWRTVWINLAEAVKAAVGVFDGIDSVDKQDWYMAIVNSLAVSGRMFRLDNIVFRGAEHKVSLASPDLFEMGPLYAMIFEPYRFLFMADYVSAGIIAYDADGHRAECDQITDLMHNPGNFIIVQDPNDPNDPVLRYWTDLGANPMLFGQNDPNIARIFNRDSFAVDLSLPVFADPNLRVKGFMARHIIKLGTLHWFGRVGGYGANGICCGSLVEPLPIDPYDGMPTYLPARYSAMEAIRAFGKPFYSPERVLMLEGALWNAGVTVWPNIVTLDFAPKYYEDLIVTIEVTNGVHSGVVVFPISVVNSPVINYPPVLQLDIRDPTFYVGQVNEYFINFIDPDCFIFEMCIDTDADANMAHMPGFPVSEKFRTDMDELCWGISEDIHSCCAASYTGKFINPDNGLFTWTPESEGAFDTIITCCDAKGGTAYGEITISCKYPPGPSFVPFPKMYFPVIIGSPFRPMIAAGGEEALLVSPDLGPYDPYRIFASYHAGFVYECDNNLMWTLLTNFPGIYSSALGAGRFAFYDMNGGYKTMFFLVNAMPWQFY